MLAAITPLASPPLLSGLLDGQPWLVSGILVVAALAVYQLTRSDKLSRTGQLGAGALVFLAVGIQILAAAITTPREELARATRTLVDVTARADTAALAPMLADDCRLFAPSAFPGISIPAAGLDKTATLAAVRQALGNNFLKEHSVRRVQAEVLTLNSGRTQVQVRVVPESTAFPYGSWWRVGWRKGAGGDWQATSIEPIELPGVGIGG